MKKYKRTFILVFLLFVSVLATVNYLLCFKFNKVPNGRIKTIAESNNTIEDNITFYSKNLPRIYTLNPNLENDNSTEIFISNIAKYSGHLNTSYMWSLSNSWITKKQIVNHTHEHIGKVFMALKYALIEKADLDMRGSQLKFLLTLEGNQDVIFKPKWYSKERVLTGPIYGGKDRHTSEIVAFYLSVILNIPFVPFCVERKILMKKEIVPVASKKFLETTLNLGNRTCVYGKCFYCSKKDAICSDQNDIITGAVIFNIKNKMKLSKSPWMRTYKVGKFARWEQNDSYCNNTVRNSVSKNRLLEMVDTAIFDFFIQNGDRHHYEILDGKIILLDNGKGLGNPYEHQIDILAPLYQCCVLRKKTWKKLLTLSNNRISHYLKLMPDVENFLKEDHLIAMDKRLLFIFGTIEYCKNEKKMIFM